MEDKKRLINELRSKVNFGLLDCKKALIECDWNLEEAYDYLMRFGYSTTRNYENYEEWRYKKYRERVKEEILTGIKEGKL